MPFERVELGDVAAQVEVVQFAAQPPIGSVSHLWVTGDGPREGEKTQVVVSIGAVVTGPVHPHRRLDVGRLWVERFEDVLDCLMCLGREAFANPQCQDCEGNQLGLILADLLGWISQRLLAPGGLNLCLLAVAVGDDFAIDSRHVLGLTPHESLELGQRWVLEASGVALVDVAAHAVAERVPAAGDRSLRDVVERFPDHLLDVRVGRVRAVAFGSRGHTRQARSHDQESTHQVRQSRRREVRRE